MSFRDLERALIDVLDRSVNKSGGDFEPQRDIHSIMVNRWNYGYAHELTSVWDPSLYGPWANQPQVKGRKPLQQRVDRQQRLGGVRLHPQRDQRGLSGGAGPAGGGGGRGGGREGERGVGSTVVRARRARR